jgi:hypothetical protein
VIIDGVWIGNWIYWTLPDPWLQVIITVSLIHTLYNSLEHTLKSSQPAVSSPVFSNGFQRRTFPFLWVPELSRPHPQQLSTAYLPACLTDWLTDWLTVRLSESESELLQDWWFNANQFVLASIEDHDQRFFRLNPCGHSPYVASSLTRGWRFVVYEYPSPLSSVRIAHTACYWKFFLLHYTQVLCQYRLCETDHAYLTYLMLQRQLSHLNGRKLEHRQV